MLSDQASDASSSPVGYPSGQREQTVNLPANAYVGSNPTPTIFFALLVARHPLPGRTGRTI
jgi:hypothetical protein